MRDPGMAQLDQMVGCGLRYAGVVYPDGGSARQWSADAHDRPVDGQQLLYFSCTEFERHRDDRIHPLPQQEVVQHAVPSSGPSLTLYSVRSYPASSNVTETPFHHRGKIPSVDGKHHHTHVVVPAGSEAGGVVRQHETELSRGSPGTFAAACRDISFSAECPRHRGGGKARPLSDVLDAGHIQLSVSSTANLDDSRITQVEGSTRPSHLSLADGRRRAIPLPPASCAAAPRPAGVPWHPVHVHDHERGSVEVGQGPIGTPVFQPCQ